MPPGGSLAPCDENATANPIGAVAGPLIDPGTGAVADALTPTTVVVTALDVPLLTVTLTRNEPAALYV